MKLLLTSSGVYNKSIAQALLKLLHRPFKKSSLVYIITAANLEVGDKTWLLDDLVRFKNLGFASIDIIDISAVGKDVWLPRLKSADVLVFGGGNEAYLMFWIEKSGLRKILPDLLKNKVYVGISAGSMVATKKLSNILTKRIFGESIEKYNIGPALGFIDFQVCPHLNSKFFPKNRRENIIKKLIADLGETVYALDDNTAIEIVNGKIKVISEGKWYKFN